MCVVCCYIISMCKHLNLQSQSSEGAHLVYNILRVSQMVPLRNGCSGKHIFAEPLSNVKVSWVCSWTCMAKPHLYTYSLLPYRLQEMSNSLGHVTIETRITPEVNLYALQRNLMLYSSVHLRADPVPVLFPHWQTKEDEKWISMDVQPALSPAS